MDEDGLKSLNLQITAHSKLPDIIISDEKRGWLFLVEVVTSHGPVSAKRVIELSIAGNRAAVRIIDTNHRPG